MSEIRSLLSQAGHGRNQNSAPCGMQTEETVRPAVLRPCESVDPEPSPPASPQKDMICRDRVQRVLIGPPSEPGSVWDSRNALRDSG